MKIRVLEKYAEKEPEKLIQIIENLLLSNNYELALNVLKKSGICISTFGTGNSAAHIQQLDHLALFHLA